MLVLKLLNHLQGLDPDAKFSVVFDPPTYRLDCQDTDYIQIKTSATQENGTSVKVLIEALESVNDLISLEHSKNPLYRLIYRPRVVLVIENSGIGHYGVEGFMHRFLAKTTDAKSPHASYNLLYDYGYIAVLAVKYALLHPLQEGQTMQERVSHAFGMARRMADEV